MLHIEFFEDLPIAGELGPTINIPVLCQLLRWLSRGVSPLKEGSESAGKHFK
jgi:hypothetical protein